MKREGFTPVEGVACPLCGKPGEQGEDMQGTDHFVCFPCDAEFTPSEGAIGFGLWH